MIPKNIQEWADKKNYWQPDIEKEMGKEKVQQLIENGVVWNIFPNILRKE